jgi:hypothetical protein
MVVMGLNLEDGSITNIDIILRLKKQLADTFDMADLGILHYFLNLQVLPLFDGLFSLNLNMNGSIESF